MKFGAVDIDNAINCILAHSVRVNGLVFKKGTVLDQAAIKQLKKADVGTVVVAKLENGDVSEDAAAGQIAEVLSGSHVTVADAFTGRANIFAEQSGVFVAGEERIKGLNRIDDAITVATLPPLSRVSKGQMVATVKIIPYSVSGDKVLGIASNAKDLDPAISVAPFRPLRVGLIISRIPDSSAKIYDKRHRAIAERMKPLGGHLDRTIYCDHQTDAVAEAVQEAHDRKYGLILLFGAVAIVDRADVIPAALEQAGGEILHLGMPVDPGNLLLYGKLSGVPVVGVPSCASSIKENGFDWVLERIFSGLPLGREDFIDMAPGGLLKEISSRPQPRESTDEF